MIFGVSIVAFLLGVPAAYFVSNYDFPLRKLLFKANILPIAIPTYIMAFTYASFFSVTGNFNDLIEEWLPFLSESINVDVMTEGWLMIFLGFALYPYVYSSSLVSFSIKNKQLDEAAASLGKSAWKRFWKVSFPLVLPAVFSGLTLVAMEVLNDYGAMSYFNVNTITAGIFQAKQMDFSSSVYLSALTFIIILSVFSVYYIVKSYRKVEVLKSNSNLEVVSLKKGKGALVSFLVFLPFFLGFILPVMELLALTGSKWDVVFSITFMQVTLNSIQLAFIPAFIIVVFSMIFLYNQYLNNNFMSRFMSSVSNIGYAIPGAIIAVAVMAFVIYFDNEDKTMYHFLINSLVLLIFAYIIRFMAVGYNTLESGFNKISKLIPDSSRSLGVSPLKTFFRVYFPLLKTTLLTTLAIVTVDILKELPITLMLQRYNFNTLATITYEKAKISESVQEAAPYALLLIFVGTLAVLFLVAGSKKGKA
jgi:iron(III) transport system permease protein